MSDNRMDECPPEGMVLGVMLIILTLLYLVGGR